MRSNDEEYLDSLLNSAQANKIKPDSALGRMSSKVRESSVNLASDNSDGGGISELVNNSNGNEDLDEIGDLLKKLDANELLDAGMGQMLDDIERPTDSSIPKFTVGNSPTHKDTRDPEEIALDEAIADAERLDAEIQSGKFNDTYSHDDRNESIVDIQEGDDALLEMAPEIALPEESITSLGPENSSDANESPEEILNGLMDEEADNNLVLADDNISGDSLSEVLDNIQDESVNDDEPVSEVVADILGTADTALDEADTSSDMSEPEAVSDMSEPEVVSNIGEAETAAEEIGDISSNNVGIDASDLNSDEEDIENLSIDEIEAEMKDLMGEDVAPSESLPDDIDLGGFTFDGADSLVDEAEQANPEKEDAVTAEEPAESGADEEPAEEAPSEGTTDKKDSSDEFDLNDMEASLDDLLGGEAADLDSIEGEVAEIAGLDEASEEALNQGTEGGEEVSIPDLDALMNSLANDEIEDLESTAQQDMEAGVADQEEAPKEDILDALTEDAFRDDNEEGGEPSLEELAAIPERKSSGGAAAEEGGEGGKKKKKGLFGLLANLFHALTEEEEEQTEGLASLTDENQTVLNELAKDEKPKKEKKKKEKKPKEKKPAKQSKPKEKKPPKPKKEKKPKAPKEPGAPEKVISPKKIALSGLFAASIGIFVFIPSLVIPDRVANERANTAYERQEYTTAYKMLYGKKMTEEQTIVYEQSRVLAWSERYLSGYQNYVAMGMKEEALDMLLMGMRNKSELLEEAAKFNVEIQVQTVYDSIESVLLEKYGLSGDDITEINSIKKDRDYTIRLMEIVGTLQS